MELWPLGIQETLETFTGKSQNKGFTSHRENGKNQ